jgi:hypothetical protein
MLRIHMYFLRRFSNAYYPIFLISPSSSIYSFFANRTLALKEIANSTKHLKKNENYNKILEKPFNFNLQTVLMVRHRCLCSLSWPNIVNCGWEVF